MRDCFGIPKVLEMLSSDFASHADDTPLTSDVKVGKKKTTIKFPCML
jgi:hypothetical protein